MAGAAPAYRYDYPERQTRPQRKVQVHVVPGRGKTTHQNTLSPQILAIAKFGAAALLVLALIGFARIALVSATVTTALASEEVAAQITSVRAASNDLEVAQSHLSNPSYVKQAAAALSMGAAAGSAALTLPADVVSTDASGNLSLSQSLAAAAHQG
ncbi:MAG: cell division protein FtsL [Eggerthellaceae bacterium]